MKKALLIFVIGLFSINVFAQSDTIAINQENRNTTIVIPQFGTTEISVVLDIFRRAGFPNPARREFQILKTDIHGWYKVLIVLIPKQN